MHGQVTKFMVGNGFSELKDSNTNYNDVSPFQLFSGDAEPTEIMLEFSNASGRLKRKIKKKTGGMRSRMATRQQARINARNRRLDIKEKQAETQRKVAEKIGTTTPEEAKLMQQLASDTSSVTSAPKGLSKSAKIGIGIGVVAVVGLIAFMVIRKTNSKKK